MTPNPILKVLSTLTSQHVSYLLMGGQACILYGAAEFSRDTDIAVLCEPENLEKLRMALKSLKADCIAVPPFSTEYLLKGHAIHFRCQEPEAQGIRLDVMAVMRGVDPFAELWERRTTLQLESGQVIELMSLSDLVRAKKTQRDKDWPMIRRLVEANYAQNQENPSSKQVEFWLRESRTPEILLVLASRVPKQAANLVKKRTLLSAALSAEPEKLSEMLQLEEKQERDEDYKYWLPLRQELESLRHKR